MSTKNISIAQFLKLAGCLVINAALIIAFIRLFDLFSVMSPLKSMLMLIVLIGSLGVSNAVLFIPGTITGRIGLVHTTTLIVATITYTIIANVISIIAISASIAWYIVWQLVVFAVYLLSLSTISFFARRTAADRDLDKVEQNAKQAVALQLYHIETTLMAKKHEEGFIPLSKSFYLLKERLQASSPFGRFAGNHQLMEMEQQILNHLEYIWMQSKLEITQAAVIEIQKLMEETRQLVMARETMSIQ
ncbi:hypothetical protein RB620_27195 [Paenibacillus sp. LHD-117]|uniref:hypothetical protein n=1 Tax=Paenibacillus sp. LHD-117 TaxID=3071412 RepID=UPI0027E1BF6B|nr:hypothetical protein [Paenibacillus sp. LHD-117]MDQ6423122.1 hypothetical protein [Paenibacillus sp. LHD-117]